MLQWETQTQSCNFFEGDKMFRKGQFMGIHDHYQKLGEKSGLKASFINYCFLTLVDYVC